MRCWGVRSPRVQPSTARDMIQRETASVADGVWTGRTQNVCEGDGHGVSGERVKRGLSSRTRTFGESPIPPSVGVSDRDASLDIVPAPTLEKERRRKEGGGREGGKEGGREGRKEGGRERRFISRPQPLLHYNTSTRPSLPSSPNSPLPPNGRPSRPYASPSASHPHPPTLHYRPPRTVPVSGPHTDVHLAHRVSRRL